MSDPEIPPARPAGDPAAQAPPSAPPIDWSTEPAPVYANGAQVASSAREFALFFTDMIGFPGRHAERMEVGRERAAVVASVRMAPDVFFDMLCVLASTWNRFANEHIDPRMRRPRFKLIDAGELQLDGLPKKPRSSDEDEG